MTADVGQGGGGGVLRLGDGPHHDIPVVTMPQTRLCSMTITSPISPSRMARAASCTEAVPGSDTGFGVISSRICCAMRSSFCWDHLALVMPLIGLEGVLGMPPLIPPAA